ncbi:hypothetical protein BI347_10505 [Chromobacterium sphagni]|uniref:Uncharacterized protein n=2 Tax=Chromobacterium sphagni TaxID=1903179 RepID=A0A1S1X323_9NEIS|nr:hypothetical protein BI347_10505 [Chromobacterium sphagni]
MFQKRLCELNGDKFHFLFTPDKKVSSKLHVALFFGYRKYGDKELTFLGVITQILALVILIIFLKIDFFNHDSMVCAGILLMQTGFVAQITAYPRYLHYVNAAAELPASPGFSPTVDDFA